MLWAKPLGYSAEQLLQRQLWDAHLRQQVGVLYTIVSGLPGLHVWTMMLPEYARRY